jgi:hypothetical protein
MQNTASTVLLLTAVLCFGGVFSWQEVTQAEEADDNKAVCDIEEICLSSIVCDEDNGELDADGDLIALRDATGAKVKKATKKAARKKARRKKATRKKATKRRAATFQFNERRGDEVSDALSDEELASLLADLRSGFFGNIPSPPCCGDGVVQSPEVCESTPTDTCGPDAFCSDDCSACLSIPR